MDIVFNLKQESIPVGCVPHALVVPGRGRGGEGRVYTTPDTLHPENPTLPENNTFPQLLWWEIIINLSFCIWKKNWGRQKKCNGALVMVLRGSRLARY